MIPGFCYSVGGSGRMLQNKRVTSAECHPHTHGKWLSGRTKNVIAQPLKCITFHRFRCGDIYLWASVRVGSFWWPHQLSWEHNSFSALFVIEYVYLHMFVAIKKRRTTMRRIKKCYLAIRVMYWIIFASFLQLDERKKKRLLGIHKSLEWIIYCGSVLQHVVEGCLCRSCSSGNSKKKT